MQIAPDRLEKYPAHAAQEEERQRCLALNYYNPSAEQDEAVTKEFQSALAEISRLREALEEIEKGTYYKLGAVGMSQIHTDYEGIRKCAQQALSADKGAPCTT